MIEKVRLTFKELVKLFEYRKNNEKHWDRPKLQKHVVNKALPIAKALYLGYLLLFLFHNATYYSIYVDNVLCIKKMNKKSGGKQI